MNSPDLRNVRRRSSTDVDRKDQVYLDIRSDIISCALKPGSAVSEAKLAERYGVGKASVRSALSRLGQEKLVISQARRSHVVAPVTIQDVIDLFGVRLALEPAAAKLAAGRVDEDLLRARAKDCEVSVEENGPENISRFLRANSEFHRTIAAASGNRRMAKLISDLLDETERVRHILIMLTDSKRETILEHGSLVHALVAGDGKKAEQLARDHIQRGWEMALSSLLSQFRFMDLDIDGPLGDLTAQNLNDEGFSGVSAKTTRKSLNTRGADGD